MNRFPAQALAAAAALSIALAGTSAAPAKEQPAAAAPATDRLAKLGAAVAHPSRTADNRARDRYRHPVETLSFFEVDPGDTVVEIWPGGGWYTKILGPYLAAGGGRLYAAAPDWGLAGLTRLKDADPSLYGTVATAAFPVWDAGAARVPDGTADVVLTFRNVHNWRMGYRRDDKQDYSAEAFRQIYAMLKPGGVLG
ncbi:MAG: methyltransferase type 11, partial [Novosphingobium sp.]